MDDRIWKVIKEDDGMSPIVEMRGDTPVIIGVFDTPEGAYEAANCRNKFKLAVEALIEIGNLKTSEPYVPGSFAWTVGEIVGEALKEVGNA